MKIVTLFLIIATTVAYTLTVREVHTLQQCIDTNESIHDCNKTAKVVLLEIFKETE